MSDDRREKGLYWDRAWKLVEGCTKVSPGCDYCWSETETVMRSDHPHAAISERACGVTAAVHDEGGVVAVSDRRGFDGRILLRHDNLDLPLRVKKPTVWAVWNDLYHEDVTDEFRDRAYAVMASCWQHTFLVLTKRPERMAEYWAGLARDSMVLTGCRYHNRRDFRIGCYSEWCYEKIWHGVTVEDQQRADERIPHLLKVPGSRFLSVEPMLGSVGILDALGLVDQGFHGSAIHAVLLGGESGQGARPMHPDWVRTVRDQCAAASVPFFFKQWGEWVPAFMVEDETKYLKCLVHGTIMCRVGKKKAGRLLDSRTHDDLPWVNQ